jgi:hypothetical protein
MVAATTLNQSCQTAGLEQTRPWRRPKGQSLFQNSTTTARMAPSWMTTRNMDMNSSLALNLTTCSTRIMWPVDEMGSHSVIPSTMPIRMAFSISRNMGSPPCKAAQALCTHSDWVRFSVYHIIRPCARKIFIFSALSPAGSLFICTRNYAILDQAALLTEQVWHRPLNKPETE